MSDLPNSSRKRDLFKRLVVRASKRRRPGPTPTRTSINSTVPSISSGSNIQLRTATQLQIDANGLSNASSTQSQIVANDLSNTSSSQPRTKNSRSTSPYPSPPSQSTWPSPSPSDDRSSNGGSVGTSRRRDFWAEAFAQLSIAEQIGLQRHTGILVGGDVNNVLEALLRDVKRQEMPVSRRNRKSGSETMKSAFEIKQIRSSIFWIDSRPLEILPSTPILFMLDCLGLSSVCSSRFHYPIRSKLVLSSWA